MASDLLSLRVYDISPIKASERSRLLERLISVMQSAGATSAEVQASTDRRATPLPLADLRAEVATEHAARAVTFAFVGPAGWFGTVGDYATGLDVLLPEHLADEVDTIVSAVGGSLVDSAEAVERPPSGVGP